VKMLADRFNLTFRRDKKEITRNKL